MWLSHVYASYCIWYCSKVLTYGYTSGLTPTTYQRTVAFWEKFFPAIIQVNAPIGRRRPSVRRRCSLECAPLPSVSQTNTKLNFHFLFIFLYLLPFFVHEFCSSQWPKSLTDSRLAIISQAATKWTIIRKCFLFILRVPRSLLSCTVANPRCTGYLNTSIAQTQVKELPFLVQCMAVHKAAIHAYYGERVNGWWLAYFLIS